MRRRSNAGKSIFVNIPILSFILNSKGGVI